MDRRAKMLLLARVAIAVLLATTPVPEALAGDEAAPDSVNPASAGWVWMPTVTLIRGMRTFDTVENRGYILVQPR